MIVCVRVVWLTDVTGPMICLGFEVADVVFARNEVYVAVIAVTVVTVVGTARIVCVTVTTVKHLTHCCSV